MTLDADQYPLGLVSNHKYNTWPDHVHPPIVVCGRCGAVVPNCMTTDEFGNYKTCIKIHDEWHEMQKIHGLNDTEKNQIQSLLLANEEAVIRTALQRVMKWFQDDERPAIAEAVRGILNDYLEEPLPHEPNPTPPFARAQPEVTP